MNTDAFKCLLCGATSARQKLEACRDYYLQNAGGPVDYAECSSCALIQQHPVPADLAALYADYPVHASRSGMQRLARRFFHRQVYLRSDSRYTSKQLLDYGCGDGTFLLEMQPRFKTVCGFEPGESHALALRQRLGLPVYNSTQVLRAECAVSFDVVTAHFVVEHVSNLHDTFATFSSVLKPGGLLHVAVPNIRSWEARLFKKQWHGLDAPRHLVFPEKSHFGSLANRYGFMEPCFGYAAFPNTLAASLATLVTGRCHPLLLTALVPFCWPVALAAPQGTLTVQMRKAYNGGEND